MAILNKSLADALQRSAQGSDAVQEVTCGRCHAMDSGLAVPEGVNLLRNGTVTALLDAVKDLVEALRIEELLELLVEYLELALEILIVVAVAHAVYQLFARLQVAWLSTSMQLVLQSMLDIILKVLRDVIAMRNVADARHGHLTHELISKTRQLSLQKAHNMAIRGNST